MDGLAEALKLAAPESGGPGALKLIDAKRDELEAAADAAEAEEILKAAPLEGITQQDKDALIAALHNFATGAKTQSGAPAEKAEALKGPLDSTSDKTASTEEKMADRAALGASDTSGTGTPGASTSTSTISLEASRTSEEAATTIDVTAQANTNPSLSHAFIAYAKDLWSYRSAVHSLIPTYLLPTSPADLTSEQHESRERLFAQYVSLYQTLGRPSNIEYSGMATIGINALQAGRLTMAATIYEIISYNTSASAALVAVMRGVWRFALYFFVFCALIFSVLYVMPSFVDGLAQDSTFQAIRSSTEGDSGKVVLAAIAGCFGGIVSLLLRLSEFETMQKRSKEFMELTGATLPLVGGISAAVVGAIFSANVINIDAGTVEGVKGLNPWAYLVIGFLAGFSERFTRSVLRVAESKFGGAGNVQQIGQPTAVLKSDMLNVDITKTSQGADQKASG